MYCYTQILQVEEDLTNYSVGNCSKQYEVIVSTVGMNIACLESQLIITRIMSKLDKEYSFLIKSIETEFHKHSEIRSCLSDLYDL